MYAIAVLGLQHKFNNTSPNPVELPACMKFGAHVSIAGGIDKAPARARALGCECFQMFTRSPRGGKPSSLNKDLVDSFLESCSSYNLPDYYIHTPYYINLASEKKSSGACPPES